MGGGRVEWKALKGREALMWWWWDGRGKGGVESIERQRSTNVVVVGWEGVGWSGKH